MQMAQPTEAHRKLECLAGNWHGTEKIHPAPWDPVGGPAKGTCENRVALDGFAVIQDYTQERNGAVNFRGHGVFYYDSERQTYVLDWLDSTGSPRSEMRGHLDGDTLRVSCQGPMGWVRCSFGMGTPGAYSFLMEVSPDGNQWFPAMEGNYTKD